MNPMVDKTLRLVLICGVAALLLGVVNFITEPIIEDRKEQEVKKALSELVESGEIGDPEAIDEGILSQLYPVGNNGEMISVILDMMGKGYGGEMRILASYTLEGALIDARLMENTETPGLGKKAESPGYMEKFIGYGTDQPIPTTKDQLGEKADAISGATITFSGISQALLQGSDFVKGLK